MLDEIRSDLKVMSETVATAREGLTRDEFVDIGDIGQQVQEIAAKVSAVGPEDAVEIKPELTGLLEEFKNFAEDVRTKLAALAEANGIPIPASENGDSEDD